MNEQKKLAQVKEALMNVVEGELMINDNDVVLAHSACGGRRLFNRWVEGDKEILSTEIGFERELHEIQTKKGADGRVTIKKTVTITSLI